MRSELPWVKVVPNKHATPKGLLPTGNELQQRLQRGTWKWFSFKRVGNPPGQGPSQAARIWT